MKIKRVDLLQIVQYLKYPPYHAVEKPIQYGIQFTLSSGVICNVYYSEKNPDECTFNIQRHQANPEHAKLIEEIVSSIAIKE
ncbi:hypothetical protein [Xenorhabdus sp. KK7.4]|uniref:hypothetical protein n=1 Tax=Xenorhabdus sp. KK7.4 TaxID=1851572 RepID=UPI000C04826F|nr:hypothetical protein [Xenorhabdus sp. KK7.4]PHM50561.1 hypothetical protein Xekk_04181 [Xenorhabdus sp. KK7.4]